MRVLSLFSGVGGFDLGLEQAGMTVVFQCENDKYCRNVLSHHWGDVECWDDISTLTGAYILEKTGGVDVVAWGSPCQNLSVAGKRSGLSGEKSKLFYEGIRIIKELRELSDGKYPKWSIWENVLGALSSNGGADFGKVLYEMDEAGACFSEWSVLDAQYFGIPQRRKRVFVVSCFDFATAERNRGQILTVQGSSHGNSVEGKSSRKDFARKIREGVEESSDVNAVLLRSREGKEGGGKGPLLSNDQSLTLQLENDQVLFVDTVAYSIREDGTNDNFSATETDVSTSLTSVVPSVQSHHAQTFIATDSMQVRRLTPIECERLMGWGDNYTLYGADGKQISDNNRYKMCGNGIASPVAKWVGQQIMEIV